MKRVYFFLFAFFSSLMIQAQNEQLDKFRGSVSYRSLLSNSLLKGYQFDFDNSTIKTLVIQETESQELQIRVVNDEKKLIGVVSAIQDQGKQQLPNSYDYVMIYRDFSNYDFETGGGFIRIYDLNYDNYLAAEFNLKDGELVAWEAHHMPEEIAAKYNFQRQHYCDKNHNGDVSWGECYSCMMDACKSDPNCNALCSAIDNFGRPPKQCTGSIAAACVIIAIMY